MKDFFARTWQDLVGRVGGPMTFRLILQPIMAAILAIRAGLRDARQEGRTPYLRSILDNPVHRRELIREGWKNIAKVFVAAIIIDLIYQIIELRWFYPTQALLVAMTLAMLPYVVIRGLVHRIARRVRGAGVPHHGPA
jgi:hypothetical protein